MIKKKKKENKNDERCGGAGEGNGERQFVIAVFYQNTIRCVMQEELLNTLLIFSITFVCSKYLHL